MLIFRLLRIFGVNLWRRLNLLLVNFMINELYIVDGPFYNHDIAFYNDDQFISINTNESIDNVCGVIGDLYAVIINDIISKKFKHMFIIYCDASDSCECDIKNGVYEFSVYLNRHNIVINIMPFEYNYHFDYVDYVDIDKLLGDVVAQYHHIANSTYW